MLTDAHCHPFDLARRFPQMEEERRKLGVLTASSACSIEEFDFCEKLAQQAKEEGKAAVFPCFAVHPQMGQGTWDEGQVSAVRNIRMKINDKKWDQNPVPCPLSPVSLLELLENLAFYKRLAAVGECGFDLYNEDFKKSEKWQEEIFAAHLETALRFDLPLILHARRAMHKIFSYSAQLKKCKAVVFHSWPGTIEEGNALLRKGINAFFSFGYTVLNTHKKQMQSCASLPADRILTETDAPFQAARGKSLSSWADLPLLLEKIASIRGINIEELENGIEKNFKKIFKNF